VNRMSSGLRGPLFVVYILCFCDPMIVLTVDDLRATCQ